MLNNIAFIGGIHGVGKSTICRQICDEVKLEYLSASELIKWNDINEDNQNKKVWDISLTQDRLIVGLENRIQKDKSYLLDGHYCLFNNENEIVNIPLGTFKLINPFSLNIILGDIIEIKNRLEKRDNRQYDQELLAQMQESELDYAKYLSKALGIVLSIGNQDDYSDILSSLRFQISKKNDKHS
ncbi:ATP-binding protein [Aquipluma nitroreducens]|uniref:ATP-binding protein n=1 Tax=Aquipluma nitroreducens TaxID=2010828 RepID=UPI00296FB7FE|nr:ATP-binding protein [Aquipluma nitroreducens]